MTLKLSRTLVLALTLVLAACANTIPLNTDPAITVVAPDYRVGDTWVYHVEDGFRLPEVWEETHTITAIREEEIVLSVTRRGNHVNDTRTEIWARAGAVKQGAVMLDETRVFELPFVRFRYPMSAGVAWSQSLKADTKYGDAMNIRDGYLSYRTRAKGWQKIASPHGDVDALLLESSVLFDDENPWYYASRGKECAWYAPSVNNVVWIERDVARLEKGDARSGMIIPVVRASFRLTDYRPAPR
ncbi:MAG: hypothetical protein LBG61_05520 [Burkholderiales bacterium]|jgi:hypothetical protein|nr:hypothetical protein [Burkholderiales bacterium]